MPRARWWRRPPARCWCSTSSPAGPRRYVRRVAQQQFLVIGAGIAGLATAVALQRRGHDVTILESRSDTTSGAGISIWPNALAALDHIGLGDAVREAGGRVTAGAMRWRDGTWLRHPSRERIVKALGEPLVVVRRSALNDVLAGALASGTVQSGLTAEDIELTPDGVRVTLSDSTTRQAGALIGADGTHSVVARYLNGPLHNRYAGYTAWRGIADAAIDPDLAGETLGAGRRMRACTAGPRPHLLVRNRAGPGGPGRTARRTGVPEDQVRVVGRALACAAGRNRPRRRPAQRPVRPRRGAGLVEGSHRSGRRRRPPDAPASRPGRLPRAGGRRDPGRLRRPEQRSGDGVRRVRDVPQADGRRR